MPDYEIQITFSFTNTCSTKKEATKISQELIQHFASLCKGSSKKANVEIARKKPDKNAFSVKQIQEYTPEEVFALLDRHQKSAKFHFQSKGHIYELKSKSDRYDLFRVNRQCVSCGIVGDRMILESQDNRIAHFNLYAVEDGKLILMTKDHRKAKTLGGKDCIENYQTMCQPCNGLKGSLNLSPDSVRILRELLKNRDNLSSTELKKQLEITRMTLVDSLDGQ